MAGEADRFFAKLSEGALVEQEQVPDPNAPAKPQLGDFDTIAEYAAAKAEYKKAKAQYEATAPMVGGPDFSGPLGAVKAGIMHAGNQFLWGGGDEAAGLLMTAPDTGNLQPGDLTKNVEEADYRLGEAQRQHPIASTIGGLLGALGGGHMFEKGVTSAGKALVPGAKKAMRAMDSTLGRTAGQAAIGAAEGATNALLEGYDPLTGAKLGAAAGGGSQMLIGELGSGLLNSFKGTPTIKNKAAAENFFREKLAGAGYGGVDKAAESLAKAADVYGPNGTVADLDPVLQAEAVNMRKGNYNKTDAITARMRNRVADDPAVLGFNEMFDNVAPRTPRQMETALSAAKKDVSEGFDVAYSEIGADTLGGNPVKFSQGYIETVLSRSGRGESSGAVEAARKKVNKTIARNVVDSKGNPWYKVDKVGKLVPVKGREKEAARYAKDLPASTLHTMRREIDAMISSAQRSKNKLNPTVVAHLAQVRSGITKKLNTLPAFKQASERYKNIEDFAVGHDLGYSLFKDGTVSPDDYAFILDNLDDASAKAFVEGAGAALQESFSANPKAFPELMTTKGSNSYEKLMQAFGKERGMKLVNGAARKEQFTTMLERMIKAGEQPASRSGSPVEGLYDLALAGTLATPGNQVSKAAGLGAAHRLSTKFPMPGQARLEKAMIDDLSQQSPETIQAYLEALTQGPKSTRMASDTVGGTVGMLPSLFLETYKNNQEN